eukprot:TRINITY_DN2575_c0_g1_i1.p1 TRINITY_DN2575_c0_g1~~TRINITY_DN2575_c0_g1_i1.p1  ORF type:complete len:508 (-),score=144.62 TRINITY_DN2575_c0_g1_i1:20-1543(-)
MSSSLRPTRRTAPLPPWNGVAGSSSTPPVGISPPTSAPSSPSTHPTPVPFLLNPLMRPGRDKDQEQEAEEHVRMVEWRRKLREKRQRRLAGIYIVTHSVILLATMVMVIVLLTVFTSDQWNKDVEFEGKVTADDVEVKDTLSTKTALITGGLLSVRTNDATIRGECFSGACQLSLQGSSTASSTSFIAQIESPFTPGFELRQGSNTVFQAFKDSQTFRVAYDVVTSKELRTSGSLHVSGGATISSSTSLSSSSVSSLPSVLATNSPVELSVSEDHVRVTRGSKVVFDVGHNITLDPETGGRIHLNSPLFETSRIDLHGCYFQNGRITCEDVPLVVSSSANVILQAADQVQIDSPLNMSGNSITEACTISSENMLTLIAQGGVLHLESQNRTVHIGSSSDSGDVELVKPKSSSDGIDGGALILRGMDASDGAAGPSGGSGGDGNDGGHLQLVGASGGKGGDGGSGGNGGRSSDGIDGGALILRGMDASDGAAGPSGGSGGDGNDGGHL